MPELLRSAALLWIGACIRNKEDREKTLNFFNGIGNTLEKTVKDFIPRGGAGNVQANEPVSDEEYK